jgi:outer membrane protein TolC
LDVVRGKRQGSDVIDAQRVLFDRERQFIQQQYSARRAEIHHPGLMLLGGLDQSGNPPAAPGESGSLDEGG